MGLMHRANSFITRHLPVKLARCQLTRPVASMTFDDFPRSAWTVGGPILARHRARATYYAAGRFCGIAEDGLDYYNAADLRALSAAGHEVGAHSHAHQMAPTLGSKALAADAERNAEALAPLLDRGMSSYAYPYGEVSPRAKAQMGARFATARGIRSGVNAGLIDLAQLRAVPLEHRRWAPAEIDAAVVQAAAAPGWVIFFTHDVSESPSPFGCTPAMLDYTLARLSSAGVQTIPVRQAMARAVFGGG
ncbi:polysaccharide deacetylase family protein [Caulobacter sp. S45]|uniref:polysaccharide deacetylase family protein n=1 Tax=Caulobacter sp. S45 TaxID=1641861 RepID=UPI0015762CF2|nr:polysaccharide deacetylase family protein [Caulobacter sp. S45]